MLVAILVQDAHVLQRRLAGSDPTRNADWKRLLEETPDAIEESFA